MQHLSVPTFSGDKSSWEKQAQAWANNFANVVMNAEGNFHGLSFSAVHSQIQKDFQSVPEKIEKVAEPKASEQEVAKPESTAAQDTAENVEQVNANEESKDSPNDEQHVAEGQQRGGRGSRGNYRPRGDGERGGRRPYNNNRGPREDADGFIEETG